MILAHILNSFAAVKILRRHEQTAAKTKQLDHDHIIKSEYIEKSKHTLQMIMIVIEIITDKKQ